MRLVLQETADVTKLFHGFLNQRKRAALPRFVAPPRFEKPGPMARTATAATAQVAPPPTPACAWAYGSDSASAASAASEHSMTSSTTTATSLETSVTSTTPTAAMTSEDKRKARAMLLAARRRLKGHGEWDSHKALLKRATAYLNRGDVAADDGLVDELKQVGSWGDVATTAMSEGDALAVVEAIEFQL